MENTKYPEEAKIAGTQGKVIVRFSVDEQGKAGRESVLKGVSPEIDAEALRSCFEFLNFSIKHNSYHG